MGWQSVAVLVEAEHAHTSEARWARIDELMAPYAVTEDNPLGKWQVREADDAPLFQFTAPVLFGLRRRQMVLSPELDRPVTFDRYASDGIC